MGNIGIGIKIRPLNGRVVVELLGEQKTPAGLILPESSSSSFQIGKVYNISDGKIEAGFLYDHQVKVGDLVIFHSNSGYPINLDEKKFKMMPESEIMAIIEGDVKWQDGKVELEELLGNKLFL